MVASIESAGKAIAGSWQRGGLGQRRPGVVAGVLGVAAALALALSACTSAQPSGSAAAGGSQPRPPRDALRVADGAQRAVGQLGGT